MFALHQLEREQVFILASMHFLRLPFNALIRYFYWTSCSNLFICSGLFLLNYLVVLWFHNSFIFSPCRLLLSQYSFYWLLPFMPFLRPFLESKSWNMLQLVSTLLWYATWQTNKFVLQYLVCSCFPVTDGIFCIFC